MPSLRLKHVIAVTGLSRMTIYRLEKAGQFPARRRLSPNSVAWLEDEVLNWLQSRPSAAAEPRANQSRSQPKAFRLSSTR